MNWTHNLYQALILLAVIAVVTSFVAHLLGPLLPSLLMLASLMVVVTMIVRGPRTKR